MRVAFRTRYGAAVEFAKRAKMFYQRPGERFSTALVRTYYPRVYRRHVKSREDENGKRSVMPCLQMHLF